MTSEGVRLLSARPHQGHSPSPRPDAFSFDGMPAAAEGSMIRTGAPGSVDRGRGGDEGLSRPSVVRVEVLVLPGRRGQDPSLSPALTRSARIWPTASSPASRGPGQRHWRHPRHGRGHREAPGAVKEALPGLRGARGSLALTANTRHLWTTGRTARVHPADQPSRRRPPVSGQRDRALKSARVCPPRPARSSSAAPRPGLPLELHQIPVSAPVTASCTGIAGWPDWRRAPVSGEGDSKT
jgi:hypothetical protein